MSLDGGPSATANVQCSVSGAQPFRVGARSRRPQSGALARVGAGKKAPFAEQGREAVTKRRGKVRQAGGGEVLVVLGAGEETSDPGAVGALTSGTNSRFCVAVSTTKTAGVRG